MIATGLLDLMSAAQTRLRGCGLSQQLASQSNFLARNDKTGA
jgi:hypothetical protein